MDKNLIIGIDADVKESGVAIKDLKTGYLELTTMSFFDLFDYMNIFSDSIKEVRIEAGWLNKKANWHNERSGTQVAAKIGSYTGANAEVGKKICEMMEYLNINYTPVKPLKKIWKKGKISHRELESIVKHKMPRTNQESRDAALLII